MPSRSLWHHCNVEVITNHARRLCFAVGGSGLVSDDFWDVFFDVASLPPWKSYDCPSATDATLKNMDQDDVIKWKHIPRYWPFVRVIHRSLHKSHWRGALMFSLIFASINGWVNNRYKRPVTSSFDVFCAWINCWENNREAGDLRRHRAHYDVIVIISTLQ